MDWQLGGLARKCVERLTQETTNIKITVSVNCIQTRPIKLIFGLVCTHLLTDSESLMSDDDMSLRLRL